MKGQREGFKGAASSMNQMSRLAKPFWEVSKGAGNTRITAGSKAFPCYASHDAALRKFDKEAFSVVLHH